MRLRNVKNAKEIVRASSFVIQNPHLFKGKYQSVFENNNPIHIEIGMGKGQFIYEMARQNPNINFIGIEVKESILVRAIQKNEKEPMPNLRFLLEDAFRLNTIFDHEISCIYLNFSDPWPKKKHAKRRLTSPEVLKIYETLFEGEKRIVQKTDNLILFASSLKNLNNFGYTFDEVSLDLANTDIPNVETEYESKFKKAGIKINYLRATKKD